jgi:hypothetical protein
LTHLYLRSHPRTSKANSGIRGLTWPWRVPAPPPATMDQQIQNPEFPPPNDPLPRALRDLDPLCPGISMPWAFPAVTQDIRLPDTEQTGTHRDRGTGQQAQAGTGKGMARKGQEWTTGQEGDAEFESSVMRGLPVSVWIMCGTHQAHACTRGCLHSPPRVERGSLAHPTRRSDLV